MTLPTCIAHFRFLAIVSILAVAAPWSHAGETFTPAHIAKLKRATAAAISPDGQHIAYGVSVQRNPMKDKNGSAWTELHVVTPDGESRPFITGEVNIGGIQWTPDGKHIAYTSNRADSDHTSIYVLPIDGGESRKLFEHEESLRGVAFSPVDSRIAFLANEPRSKEQKELRDKGFDQEIYEEDWRPRRVWIVDPDSDEEAAPLDIEGSAFQVEFSPDGKKLVVTVAPTSLVDDSYMYKYVLVVDAKSGRVIDRIKNAGKLGDVHWSPDGKKLAMISAVDIHDPQDGHLMIATLPNGELTDLTPELDGHVDAFEWRDDETIVCTVGSHQDSLVATVGTDGTMTTVVAAGEQVVAGVSLSESGDVAMLGHSPQFPHEVFLLAQGSDRPKRLTDVNPWLKKMAFAKQEVVKWSARDGLEIEGVLIYPRDYEAGRRYPLIMAVHGGPEAHVSNGWVTSYSYPGQTAAARGFAVLYPNYRGSTGRGVEFSKMGQSDAAGKEFDDIVDAIDHLVEEGLVDKDRVGITGGSYGGYASAWGATYYSDRYAASVMFVGISDSVSKLGTTDIPEESFLVHHLKRLWEDWDYFLDRSPIRHIEKNQTPTLILHGKNDPRVHPSQSLEFFRHLKTLKQAPVRLVLYEGEGHGNRKAASRLDYNLRMLRWMEHFLQGDNDAAPEKSVDYKALISK
jgi:dipeptidyl aminopeptidase/acylaminoacyl peptidase